jgi:endonuclease/exonuclease/phosphatase family metal-dependent hydrolase
MSGFRARYVPAEIERACVRLAILLLAFAVATAGAAEPRVRVATFNVRNYLAMDRRVEGRFRPGYPKPENEKAAIRAAIRAVRPDVLALQEIGPGSYLEELRRDLRADGCEFQHAQLLEAADAERHVAVLSRVPFTRVTEHEAIEFSYRGRRERVKRGLLEVTFSTEAGEWTLFVVHLKSRHTDRRDDPLSAERRLGEARAIRDLIMQRCPAATGARFLVVGDFNDTSRSKTVAAMTRRGRRAIADPLPAADSRGETWTQRYLAEDVFSRTDYIMASDALRPFVVDGRAQIHDDPAALEGSDHRLVYVDLRFSDAP